MKSQANQTVSETRRQIRKRPARDRKSPPKYCGPHSSGKGYVWEGRKAIYFPGAHNSMESLQAYRDYCLKLLGKPADPTPPSELTILMLFKQFAIDRLPQLPKTEQQHYRSIIKILSHVFGDELAYEFGPLKLQQAREIFANQVVKGKKPGDEESEDEESDRDDGQEVSERKSDPDHEESATGKPPKPWSRTHVNAMTKRLTRLFKWAVSVEQFPADKWLAMKAIAPLKAGESIARETEAVRPVSYETYQKAMQAASPTVAAMMRIHWLTGMRSSNICEMRPCDIDMAGDVWTYVPESHKTAWKQQNLFVALGPESQSILQPFIDRRQSTEFIFSPRESAEWKSDQRWKNRKSPKWDSARKRRGKINPRIGTAYTKWTYRQAIHHAAKLAKVAIFNPHQLRHARGTEIRRKFGAEAAQVSLGHATLTATQIYAERDMELARKVAREMG